MVTTTKDRDKDYARQKLQKSAPHFATPEARTRTCHKSQTQDSEERPITAHGNQTRVTQTGHQTGNRLVDRQLGGRLDQ